MANEKIVGITLNGTDYDYEDSETKDLAAKNAAAIGDLSELETEDKTSLVAAINEAAASGDGALEAQITGTEYAVDAMIDFEGCYSFAQVVSKNAAEIAKLKDLKPGIVTLGMWQDMRGDSGDDTEWALFNGSASAVVCPSDNHETTGFVKFYYVNENYFGIIMSVTSGSSNSTYRDWMRFEKNGEDEYFYIDGNRVYDGSDEMWVGDFRIAQRK